MADSSETENSWEIINLDDVPIYIRDYDVLGIRQFCEEKRDSWKDILINIGVTGDSGVGKSSFINAIRGLEYNSEVEGAAPTGALETTTRATPYRHTASDKIQFWDLPGIGTPNYPNLEDYCNKVNLLDYDTFLIFTAGRFTENDSLLAKKIEEINKSYLFVRTKIDFDVFNESGKKSFNEDALLKAIRKNCFENLTISGNEEDEKEVFLISSCTPEKEKWDFANLTNAILNSLEKRQKESLTLTLDLSTSRSKDFLKRKVEILQGRVWMTAAASGIGGTFTVPGFSIALDLALLQKELNFYKSQLDLPNEDSYMFQALTPDSKEKVRKFFLTGSREIVQLAKGYIGSSAVAEDVTRFIPVVGSVIAGSISFASTYVFLQCCLKDMEEIAIGLLDEKRKEVGEKLGSN